MKNPNNWDINPIIVIEIKIVKVSSVPINSLDIFPTPILVKLLKAKYNKGYLSNDVDDISLLESIETTMYFILFTLLIILPIVNTKTKNNIIICLRRNNVKRKTQRLIFSILSSSFSSESNIFKVLFNGRNELFIFIILLLLFSVINFISVVTLLLYDVLIGFDVIFLLLSFSFLLNILFVSFFISLLLLFIIFSSYI
jgi:hypothetical protein